MPKLEHLPHEKFAHFIARGNHLIAAMRAAGYYPDREVGEQLLKIPRISNRIAELTPVYTALTHAKRRKPKRDTHASP